MNVGVLGDYVIYAGSESDYDVAGKLYSIHAEDVAMEMSYDELEVWWQPTVIYDLYTMLEMKLDLLNLICRGTQEQVREFGTANGTGVMLW